MRQLVYILAMLGTGCGPGGLLTGDTEPDRWAKVYCLDGTVHVDASGGFAAGGTMGEIRSHGVVAYGAMPDDVLVILAGKTCDGEDASPGLAPTGAETFTAPPAPPGEPTLEEGT